MHDEMERKKEEGRKKKKEKEETEIKAEEGWKGERR